MNKVCVIGSYAKALVMTSNRIPLAGETLVGYDYRETYGGKGSDMAVQAARLGADVDYIGVVGDDLFGNEFEALMKQEKINTKGLRITSEQPTGVGFIVKDVNALNVIIVDKGANALFSTEDIDAHLDLIKECDVVLAQLEIPLETALYAMKKAKELGKITVLNPAPAVDLSNQDLSNCDYVTPNETEARVVVGMLPTDNISNRQAADKLLANGCKSVVMTLGGDGVDYFTTDESRHFDSYKIDVVDSNGAGDSFNASFCTALSRNLALEDAVKYAKATAGLCCTKWETVPSYHTHKQVIAFIESKE